ncbi:TIGR03943 family putative permease subunit [Peribacillus simplex]|uniref:TIGR03943 family putative permease subunit n=1 Tax=Peribacillus simplex TaxID=1478 RepID=UPI003D2A01E0
MQLQFQQVARALILLAFSALIFKLHLTGEITKFINPKYGSLSQVAAVIFLILFFIQITRTWKVKKSSHHHCDHHDHVCDHNHDHGDSSFNTKKLISYFIIVFPVLTGFLLPPKVLDASIANKKGAMLALSNQKQAPKEDKNKENNNPSEEMEESNINGQDDPYIDGNPVYPALLENQQEELSKEEYNQLIQQLEQNQNIEMNDYVYAAYYEEMSKDINKFKGRKIELKGFVYKEDGFAQNQLVISRFLISHCVADASIIGFLSEFPEASSLDMDTWIKANGVIEITTYDGKELPVIKITNWEKISEPDEPYLYPINVKM